MKYIDDNGPNQRIYFEIGEEFEVVRNGVTIKMKCEETLDSESPCDDCLFVCENGEGCRNELRHIPFACSSNARPDGKDVVFMKVIEQ